MTTIGAYEAKTHLPRLLDEVERGKTVLITRHGRPVARLVPVGPLADPETTVAAIREARKGVSLGGLGLQALIEEGRR